MPGQPVVLDSFGGLVTTTRPEDLPEGASPRNNDVDFIVGRFIQRPGCNSVYTLAQAEYGPKGGAVASDIAAGPVAWENPSNILLDDGNYATAVLSTSSSLTVGSVTVTNGGFYKFGQTPVAIITGPGAGAVVSITTVQRGFLPGVQWWSVESVAVVAGGIYTGPATISFTGADAGNDAAATVTMNAAQTDILQVSDFGFSVPYTYQINGISISVKGFAPNGANVYAQLLQSGIAVGNVKSIALPAVNGTVSMGSASDLWGSTWNNADVAMTTFGVNLWVNFSPAGTVSLDFASIALYGTPQNANFNGIGSVNLNQTDQTTLALDANGLTWKEDAANTPGQLALESGIPAVMVGSYLKAVDANGVAYMAYSDLTQGTSQPMQYNGAWCDRITQVGPGQAPIFTPQQTTSDTFSITNITQPPQKSDPDDPGHLQTIQWSVGPTSTAPGNVITVFYGEQHGGGSSTVNQDTDLVNAFNSGYAVYVYMSGLPSPFVDGTYQVTSVGGAVPPGGDGYRFYFTYLATSSQYNQIGGPDTATGYYQRTLATLTMAVPVPGLVDGNQITIAGNSVAGYNSAWTITQTINSGQMQITETGVTGGIATYNYAMQSGVAPTAGELVTITNTTNANGSLNLTNATIATSSGGETGNFTVLVSITETFAPSAEPSNAVATTAGTIFTFDPGAAVVNTSTNPIYGTGTGGTLTFSSAINNTITPGVKQGSVFFITRASCDVYGSDELRSDLCQQCPDWSTQHRGARNHVH